MWWGSRWRGRQWRGSRWWGSRWWGGRWWGSRTLRSAVLPSNSYPDLPRNGQRLSWVLGAAACSTLLARRSLLVTACLAESCWQSLFAGALLAAPCWRSLVAGACLLAVAFCTEGEVAEAEDHLHVPGQGEPTAAHFSAAAFLQQACWVMSCCCSSMAFPSVKWPLPGCCCAEG